MSDVVASELYNDWVAKLICSSNRVCGSVGLFLRSKGNAVRRQQRF
jgi:hypothetical protein